MAAKVIVLNHNLQPPTLVTVPGDSQPQTDRLRLDVPTDAEHAQPIPDRRSHALTITREFGDYKVSCSCGQVSAPLFYRVDAVIWKCPSEEVECVGVKNWAIWAQRAADAARDGYR